MVLGLARPLAVERGVPAPAQLLERRHVDAAVVEVVVELGHVAGEEARGRCRCCCRRAARSTRFGTCCFTYASARLLARRRRRPSDARSRGSSPDFVCILRTKSSMRRERRRRRRARRARCRRRARRASASVTMHAISTITSRLDVEAGHLEVDPHQPVVVAATSVASRARSATRRTLSARVARVDSRPMPAPAVVWRPDAELLRDSNVARFMAAEGIADFPDARARGRSTSPSGSGTRSCASSASRSRRRTTQVLDTSRRHPVGQVVHRRAVQPRRRRASTAGPTTRRRRRRRGRLGRRRRRRRASSPGAELRALTDAHRAGLAARGVRRGRRGRAVPADGARDGRRAVRGRQARRDLPPDLLRLRRRRGRGAPRRRGRGRADHRRRLHAAGQGRADEGDRRRRGRAGRRRVHTVVVVPRLGRADVADDARTRRRRSPTLTRARRRSRSTRSRSTASIRCSSRTRAARPAGRRARCTCTAASS